MPKRQFTESDVEEAALTWFEGIGYQIAHGPEIAPEEPKAERDSFEEVVLKGRLKKAIEKLLPKLLSGEIRIKDAEKFVEGM